MGKLSYKRRRSHTHKQSHTHKCKRSHTHLHKCKRSHTHKRKRTYRRKSHKRYAMSGGNYAAYPEQAFAPPMAGNGIGQLGEPYNAAGSGTPSGNHLTFNENVKAPPMPSNPQTGGHKRRTKIQKGGGVSSFISSILPAEVTNIGRSVPAAVGHFSDKFNGVISSPSSMVYPTQQPLVGKVDATTIFKPVDLQSVYQSANNAVLAL